MSRTESQRHERADVVVIGGGPAGSAMALRMARLRRHVVQLERRELGLLGNDPFRSGEGVLPSTVRALRRLKANVDPDSWTLGAASRVRVRWPNGHVTMNELVRDRSIRMIDREQFDLALWRAATAAGVDSRCGWDVQRLLLDGDVVIGVVAADQAGDVVAIEAPLVTDAGGRNAPSVLQFELRQPEVGDDFVAVVLFFDDVPELQPDVWEMHFWDADAPCVMQGAQLVEGVARFGLGTYLRLKQGSGLTPEDFFWQQLRSYPELEARLRAGSTIRSPYTRARLGYQTARIARGGLMLIGDAAGYLNPILGDGILLALRSAEQAGRVAAEAFDTGDFGARLLQRYQRRWWRSQRARLWFGRALLASHRYPALVNQLGDLAPLRELALHVLTRP